MLWDEDTHLTGVVDQLPPITRNLFTDPGAGGDLCAILDLHASLEGRSYNSSVLDYNQ